jgi:hypothetical protein
MLDPLERFKHSCRVSRLLRSVSAVADKKSISREQESPWSGFQIKTNLARAMARGVECCDLKLRGRRFEFFRLICGRPNRVQTIPELLNELGRKSVRFEYVNRDA